MYIKIKKIRIYPAVILSVSTFGSMFSPVYAEEKPREQTFVVTAYYSPLQNQCCYFRGSYEEEIQFNGEGIKGADQTGVYPGMIAAPETYAFGTVIDLPGVGIGTVHDRGGRIIEWADNVHRIDLWMGYGEEGLARALAWGARKVTGTVYPVGSEAAPAEKFTLATFDADKSILTSIPKRDPIDVIALAEFGSKDYSAKLLQTSLRNLGYFTEQINGNFGPATKAALAKFLADYGLPGDGSSMNPLSSATLAVAQTITDKNLPVITIGTGQGTNGDNVRQVQKVLRYLGRYKGRTDGVYDQNLREAVTAFQIQAGVIKSSADAGAGRVGPATKNAIQKAWRARIVALKGKSLADKMELAALVKEERLPKAMLSKGDHGKDVSLLQEFLRDLGYLAAKDVTGTFGARTESALLKYQVDKKIIVSQDARGAGVFGPATKTVVTKDAVQSAWQKVRSGAL